MCFGIVYCIVNIINGKYYIGQTIKPLEKRWTAHKSSAARGSRFHLHNAIRKYGKDNFVLHVIAEMQSQEELDKCERVWIALTRSFDRSVGYNLTFGGDGVRPDDDSRKRRSEWMKGRTVSDETRRKLSESHKGKPNAMKGRLFDVTVRKRMSEAHIGKPPVNKGKRMRDICPNYVHWATGTLASDETRRKLSEAHKGHTPWNKGIRHHRDTKV